MKNLKIFFLLFFSIASLSINSQEKRPNKEKIKELKIAFLTEKLDLSVEEAEKFWPVYNKHDDVLRKIRTEEHSKIRKKIKNAGSLDNITNADAEKLVKDKLELEARLLKENEAFITALSTFLPYQKILKFNIAEREFGRKLLARYKRGRNNKK
jgi:hypothetical protein